MAITYRTREQSLFNGHPMEIYHFYRGSEDWFYTGSKFIILFESNPYLPLEIARGQIETGGEDKPGALTVTFPTDSDLGLMLQQGSAPTPISLRIIRIQRDNVTDPAVIFIGEISNADIQGEQISIQVLPFTARLDLTIPQGLYQREQCQWNTYDPNTCGVDKATYTFTGTVTAIDGLIVTVPGAAAFDPGTGVRDDMFVSGILQEGERQGMIDTQNGDDIVLLEPIPGLAVSDSVDLIAGDNRLQDTCTLKFNNAARRLAFKNMPVANPFYGQGLRV